MKYFFPPQNQNFKYLQTNRSDNLGSIWSSFNLDFLKKLGTLKLSNKIVTNTTSSDDADLGLPVAFEFWYSKWWAICGIKLFKTSDYELTGGFTEDSGIGWTIGDATTQFDITNPSGTTFRYTYDMTGRNPSITALSIPIGATVIIADTDMAAGNNGTFTVTGSGANYFEVTNASGAVETNKVIGSGSIVVIGGTQGNFTTTGSDMKVFNDKLFVSNNTGLFYRNNDTSIWIGVDWFSSLYVPHQMCYFKKFDRIYYIADSTSIRSVDSNLVVASSGDYTLNTGKSVGWLSGMVQNSSYIWISSLSSVGDAVDSGKLSATISQWDGVSNQVSNEFILESGGIMAMTVLNDVPYAIDTEGRILKYTGYSFEEVARLPIDMTLLANSSIATSNRWIHFNGLIPTKNNTLLINVNNLNGDNGGTINENFPSGIWELDVSTNNLTHKYAPTLKSKGSSTVTDFGQNRVSAVGALKINNLQSASENGRSTILAGFNYFTDATTIKSGIFIDSPSAPNTDLEGQKRGYFVTTQFESYQISDNWLSLWAIFKQFANDTDKLIFKYRLSEENPIYATITWVNTTSFTTTTDVSDYIGYEVEIIQGTGSGSCHNISNVTENAGTYTVTLDTAITGVTGTAKARFQKWIKLGEISNQVLSYGQLPIETVGVQIQIKGILEWTGDGELVKMILNSKEDINIDS